MDFGKIMAYQWCPTIGILVYIKWDEDGIEDDPYSLWTCGEGGPEMDEGYPTMDEAKDAMKASVERFGESFRPVREERDHHGMEVTDIIEEQIRKHRKNR